MAAEIWPTPKPALLAAYTILKQGFVGTDVKVSTQIPARNRPNRFVVIDRAGGGQDHVATDTAAFIVHCFGRSTAETEGMCNRAREIFRNAVGTTVDVVIVDGFLDSTNPDHDTPPDVMPLAIPPPVRMFIRGYTNETGVAGRQHPDVEDRVRWQFSFQLGIKSN